MHWAGMSSHTALWLLGMSSMAVLKKVDGYKYVVDWYATLVVG